MADINDETGRHKRAGSLALKLIVLSKLPRCLQGSTAGPSIDLGAHLRSDRVGGRGGGLVTGLR